MSFDFATTGVLLPEDWQLKRIGDVADINPDTVKKRNEPHEIFYIDISSVSTGNYEPPTYMEYKDAPSRAKRRLRSNDFIISTVRPNLKQFAMLEVVDENWVASTGFCVVRPKDERAAWYLYSFVTSEIFNEHLVRVADGAAYPSFNPKEIEDAIIPWPPANSLFSINDFAKALDNKIELNRQTNQTLEYIAQAIFKSWFVDFEPTRAKVIAKQKGGDEEAQSLAAQAIICGAITLEQLSELSTGFLRMEDELHSLIMQRFHNTPAASLDEWTPESISKLADQFPDALVDSELGEIPEGWRVKEIKDLALKISKGTTPRKADIQKAEDSETIPFLKVRDISNDGEITRIGLDEVPESIHIGVLKRSILKTSDLLFSIAGTIGRVALVEEDLSNSNCNQAIAFIRLEEPEKYLELCRLNLISNRIQDEVISKVVQGVQANFSLTGLGQIKVLLPSEELLVIFNKNIGAICTQQRLLHSESRKLSELRDALLPKLLSGQLEVRGEMEIA